jgi:hypothetical protein
MEEKINMKIYWTSSAICSGSVLPIDAGANVLICWIYFTMEE